MQQLCLLIVGGGLLGAEAAEGLLGRRAGRNRAVLIGGYLPRAGRLAAASFIQHKADVEPAPALIAQQWRDDAARRNRLAARNVDLVGLGARWRRAS